MSKYRFITMDQPAGRFYIATINAKQLISISQSDERTPYNATGIQRKLSQDRVNEIANYCQKSDAMFPTPIILSGDSSYFKFFKNEAEEIDEYTNLNQGYIEIDVERIIKEEKYFSIVDGQHRLAGIERSNISEKFDLLAMFTFDSEPFEDANIFSIINRNQKQVSKSLVYDLYGLSSVTTVEKFAHEIVKVLNDYEGSQLWSKIKMLGYKFDYLNNSRTENKQFVTQGALVDEIMPLISSNYPKDNELIASGDDFEDVFSATKPLRKYFVYDNYFLAQVHMVSYINAWIEKLKATDNISDNSIMFKTIGFIAALDIFKILYSEIRTDKEKLDECIADNLLDASNLDRSIIDEYQIEYKSLLDRYNFDEIDTNTISSSRSGAKRIVNLLLGN